MKKISLSGLSSVLILGVEVEHGKPLSGVPVQDLPRLGGGLPLDSGDVDLCAGADVTQRFLLEVELSIESPPAPAG